MVIQDDKMTVEFSLGEETTDPVIHDEKQVQTTAKLEARQRWMLVFFSALYSTLFAGAFFGFGPMQLMLEENGVFSDQCAQDEETPCPAQTSRLLQVHFIAQLTLMFSPIAGALADRYSARVLMYITAAVGLFGLIFILVATGLYVDNLLYLSDLLLGLMATCSSVMIVQTGLVFTTVTRQRVISVLNTLYDAGALTYLALWAIENALGCGITAIVGGYLGVAVVCFGGAIYYWRRVVPVQEDETVTDDSLRPADSSQRAEKEEDVVATEEQAQDEEQSSSTIHDADEEADQQQEVSSNDDDYVLIANRTPSEQLKSKLYVVLCIFFAIHGTKNNFTLTTARDFLAYLGDDEYGNKYLTIFTLLTPVSILGLPFMDFILNRYGYHAGFQSINILSLAHGIILTSSDNLNVQILGFLIFSFFRCFLFTVSFSFVPTFQGQTVVGRGTGIMTFCFGLLSLVNIGLSSWAINGLGGNFFWPNLILTLAVIPCIALAWIMGKCIQQEQQAKLKLKGG